MSLPSVLYHGSSTLVTVLEPQGTALEPRLAVYAAHDSRQAIPFALAYRPDETGRLWGLDTHADEPRITIHHGWLDTSGTGYLYRLPADGFEQVDHWQWVCRRPVTPLDHQVIRCADYVRWIVAGETR